MLTKTRSWLLRLAGGTALAAAALLPLTVAQPAHAWGLYVGIPAPVVVAPPVYVAPPPVVAYAAPYPYGYYGYGPRIWVGPGWFGGRFYPGHWRYR